MPPTSGATRTLPSSATTASVTSGTARPGSPPKRRSVHTVLPWTVEVLTEWVEEVLPAFGCPGPALWPTERSQRLTLAPINHRFTAYRDALGLPAGLALDATVAAALASAAPPTALATASSTSTATGSS